jgi:hypothetical protein
MNLPAKFANSLDRAITLVLKQNILKNKKTYASRFILTLYLHHLFSHRTRRAMYHCIQEERVGNRYKHTPTHPNFIPLTPCVSTQLETQLNLCYAICNLFITEFI